MLRLEACYLCGTDIHHYESRPTEPMISGHEPALRCGVCNVCNRQRAMGCTDPPSHGE